MTYEPFEKVRRGEVQGEIVCGDCLEVVAAMPDGCVNLMIADPPYGLGVWSWVEGWIEVVVQKMRPDASVYIFCGIGEKSDSLSKILPIVKEHLTFKNLITWKKLQARGTQRNWMHTREEIIFAVKGKGYVFCPQYGGELRSIYSINPKRPRKSPYKRVTNVWADIRPVISGVSKLPECTGHPTQKPEKLVERIILASSNESDLVFDPFMGTGTTAVVADRLGRKFFGCDISEEYVKMALKRIEEDRKKRSQLELF